MNSLYVLRCEESHFIVIEAESGQQALDILQDRVVDVIISDQKMPRMSGTELFAIVKVKYPSVGRILLSGQSDFEDLCAAINEARVSHFLLKPWDKEQLMTAVYDVVPQGVKGSTMVMSKKITSIESLTEGESKKDVRRGNKVMAAIIKEAILRNQ